MAIVGHTHSPFLGLQARVEFVHHLTCNTLIFYVSVAVSKAAALLASLLGSHFYLPSTLNEFLQILGH